MFSPYMPYSGEQGLVTNDQNVVLLLVFSEPVNGLTASSFSISGPSGATVSGLKLLRGTNTYYHFTVNLPGTYYDAVTVNLQVRLACCKMPAAVFLSHRLAILRKKRKDYATYAVALYMGDKCVEHCPPGHTHHSCTVWPGKLSPVAVFFAMHRSWKCADGFSSVYRYCHSHSYHGHVFELLDEQQSLVHLQLLHCIHGLLVHAGHGDRHSWKGQPGCQPLELYQSGVSTAVWHIV